LTVDQKVKVVLFYAETKRVVATQRCFLIHFGTRSAILQTFNKLVTSIAFSVNYSIHSHVCNINTIMLQFEWDDKMV
jgi:hypothetical protein